MSASASSSHRLLTASFLLLTIGTAGAADKKEQAPAPLPAPMLLAGGRSLAYEGSFATEREVRGRPGFWGRLVDIVAGPPDLHQLLRPYSVVTDSRGRAIVTDPGQSAVHIFDFERKRYKFITRDSSKDPLKSPQCVAVDDKDNIYVTDSDAGKIFVFDRDGKFRRALGSLRGGEGYFKRPTGIALDTAAGRIYVTDTLRHKIFVLDLAGKILQEIGQRGVEDGQFNFPTELRLHGNELLVVDAMNFRVQALDRSGKFLWAIGQAGEATGSMFRPKGVGRDSEGDLYVVEGLYDTVQVFDPYGRLLYYFGGAGDGPQEFQLPAGLFIDRNDRIFVVDSYNRRVQVFRFTPAAKPAPGGAP